MLSANITAYDPNKATCAQETGRQDMLPANVTAGDPNKMIARTCPSLDASGVDPNSIVWKPRMVTENAECKSNERFLKVVSNELQWILFVAVIIEDSFFSALLHQGTPVNDYYYHYFDLIRHGVHRLANPHLMRISSQDIGCQAEDYSYRDEDHSYRNEVQYAYHNDEHL